MMKKIIETDNFGRDYPDESFLNIPYLTEESCEEIVDIINNEACDPTASRIWRVVDVDYKLQPGFEP